VGHREIAVAAWRDVLNEFNLAFPSFCIESITRGYSACGAYRKPTGISNFEGNFWWADCGHVAALTPVALRPDNAFDAEFTILNVTQFKGSTQYHAFPFAIHCTSSLPDRPPETKTNTLCIKLTRASHIYPKDGLHVNNVNAYVHATHRNEYLKDFGAFHHAPGSAVSQDANVYVFFARR